MNNIYATASNIVLNRYYNQKDSLGRCQKWKIAAIQEDRQVVKHSGVIDSYIDELEEEVKKLENNPALHPPVATKQTVVAAESTPTLNGKPITENNHLDWN